MTTDHAQMVADCELRESRLTDWEIGFIDSIRTVIEKGYTLSDKQDDKLNTIWDRVTSDG